MDSEKRLKTLKDLQRLQGLRPKEYAVYISDLREEAIKWVKNMIEVNKELPFDYGGSAIAFAQEFFNITEEDLKDEM